MNLKSMLCAVAVQLLADNTNIIRKETRNEQFINSLFGIETDQQRVTRETEELFDKTVANVKRISTNREFKKIVKNAV